MSMSNVDWEDIAKSTIEWRCRGNPNAERNKLIYEKVSPAKVASKAKELAGNDPVEIIRSFTSLFEKIEAGADLNALLD